MSSPSGSYSIRLGRRLRAARRHLGRSQSDVADTAGIARESLGRYERGEVTPSAEILTEIARALPGISVEWLVMGSEGTDDTARAEVPDGGGQIEFELFDAIVAALGLPYDEPHRLFATHFARKVGIVYNQVRSIPGEEERAEATARTVMTLLQVDNQLQRALEDSGTNPDLNFVPGLSEKLQSVIRDRLRRGTQESEGEDPGSGYSVQQEVHGSGNQVAGRDIGVGRDKKK